MHAYRKAVVTGLVPPINCPEDDEEMVPVVALDALPALKCLNCGVVFRIGSNVYDKMKANLDEL